MGITLAAVALLALIGLAMVLAGLVNRHRSILLGVAALVVALLAGGGAWYAWAESHSTAWTLGYGAVVVLALVAFIRQFVIGNGLTRARSATRSEAGPTEHTGPNGGKS